MTTSIAASMTAINLRSLSALLSLMTESYHAIKKAPSRGLFCLRTATYWQAKHSSYFFSP